MVCGTIYCSGLGGPSGYAPSTHREAPGVAPSLLHFFALQIRVQWEWGKTPTSHWSGWGGRIWSRGLTFTPSLMRDQGVPYTLEGLQQQWNQLVERGRVRAQLGALGGLQTATWVTLMYFCCLAVYLGTWWLCLQLLPPAVGCAMDRYQGQFRSLVLHSALVYPCSYSGAGEYKATCLTGLVLAWYAAEPLCCAPCMHTHTSIVQYSGAA